jgi:hypothetical protein
LLRCGATDPTFPCRLCDDRVAPIEDGRREIARHHSFVIDDEDVPEIG